MHAYTYIVKYVECRCTSYLEKVGIRQLVAGGRKPSYNIATKSAVKNAKIIRKFRVDNKCQFVVAGVIEYFFQGCNTVHEQLKGIPVHEQLKGIPDNYVLHVF